MGCLEMLSTGSQYITSSTDRTKEGWIVILMFFAIGAVLLFEKMVNKYAPQMNDKLKSGIGTAIAVTVILLGVLLRIFCGSE